MSTPSRMFTSPTKTGAEADQTIRRMEGMATEPGLEDPTQVRAAKLKELGEEYEQHGWDGYEAEGDHSGSSIEHMNSELARLRQLRQNMGAGRGRRLTGHPRKR